MAKKTGFYTRDMGGGTWTGYSHERPDLQYSASSRDAAWSGVKRLFKREEKRRTAAPAPVQPKAYTPRPLTRVVFVLDRSGSMAGIMTDAIAALRSNINDLTNEGRRLGQEFVVSAVFFDTLIEVPFSDVDVVRHGMPHFVDPLPRACTALNDAVIHAIRIAEADRTPPTLLSCDSYDVAHLVIVITDGEENMSKTRTEDVSRRIRELTATDRWTFTFLVPPRTAQTVQRLYGCPHGNVREWEATTRGVFEYAQANTQGITNYAAARSVGSTKVDTFYTNVDKLTAKDVSSSLIDVSSDAKVIKVDKESDIRPFIEKEVGAPYLPGHAFYQLTKEEKRVQPYKKILVQEKGKRAIYGGAQARKLIGLPTDKSVKVIPGNHANWDIFVQSTSVNRKLVRGTKVVYFPSNISF